VGQRLDRHQGATDVILLKRFPVELAQSRRGVSPRFPQGKSPISLTFCHNLAKDSRSSPCRFARSPSGRNGFAEQSSRFRRSPMRGLALAFMIAVLAFTPFSASSEETPRDVQGLFLVTDYPSITVRPGTTSTISLRLQNYGRKPEPLELKVEGA